jgi:16S rRNA processing protein RimM
MPTPAADDFAIVGRVRKVHGLRGDLIIESLTDEPDAIFAPGRRVFAGTASGEIARARRELTIAESRPQGEGWRVHFAEIPDRTAAELWRDRYLLVPMSEITPLGDDEVYLHELDGMRVQLVDGTDVGVVVARYELPQGLMLDVRRAAGGGTVMIPYAPIVTRVDRAARVITIDPPEGLLD